MGKFSNAAKSQWTSSSQQMRLRLVILLLGLVTAVGLAAQGQTAPTTGAISGVVVDAATGAPLGDAYVQLQGLFAGGGGGPMPRKVTDAKGRFIFAPVGPGDGYLLTVNKAGYLEGGFHRGPTEEAGALLALREGQWRNDLTIRLWKTASISGTVLDERGRPIVDVMVHLASKRKVGASDAWLQMGAIATDDRGMYRFGRLPPGEYVAFAQPLHVTLPRDATSIGSTGRPGTGVVRNNAGTGVMTNGPVSPPESGRAYTGSFYPTGARLEDATVITLSAGEERTAIDIGMSLRPTVAVSGRVLGPPEVIGKLPLRLVPSGATAEVPSTDLALTQTDATGAFTFAHVPEGDYLLMAGRTFANLSSSVSSTTTNWPPSVMQFTSTSMATIANGLRAQSRSVAGPDATAEVPISVGRTAMSDVVVPLTPTVSISGESRFRPDDGLTAGGTGPSVQFVPMDGLTHTGLLRSPLRRLEPPVTSPLPFTIEGVRPGRYLLASMFIGGPGLQAAEWNGRNLFEQPIEVEPGVPVTGVVLTLGRLNNSVSGTVNDAVPGGPHDLAVMVFPESPALWGNVSQQMQQFQLSFVGRTNNWRLSNLPPGSYLAAVVPVEERGAIFQREALERLSTTATRFSMDVGSAVTLSLSYRGPSREPLR
jgi:hypothetical protein